MPTPMYRPGTTEYRQEQIERRAKALKKMKRRKHKEGFFVATVFVGVCLLWLIVIGLIVAVIAFVIRLVLL